MEEACRTAGRRIVPILDDNAWGVLKRVFLQAGRAGEWGLTFPRRGMSAITQMLTAAGFSTTKEDVTYAARRKGELLPHCVAVTDQTITLLRVILAEFPTFDYRQAFRLADLPELKRRLTPAILTTEEVN